MLLSNIQGTQALIHYIERSTTQLVEYKALNLVDVGSSPMVEITSDDVIMNELYTKVPAHYCIMTRPLGATLVEVFYEHKAITSPRLLSLGGYIYGVFSLY